MGPGFRFSGNTGSGSDYLSLPTSMSVRGLLQASIAVRYLPLGNPGSNAGIYYECTNTAGYTRFGLFHQASSTDLRAAARDSETGSVFAITETGGLALNAWHHIVLTYDSVSDSMLLYRNGAQVGSNATAKGAFTNTAAADGPALGAFTYSTVPTLQQAINGRIVDFRIYNRVLSPDEVWATFDPSTRWDLYAPVRKIWAGEYFYQEQTALEDAALDLSAYYQALEDVTTWLRATDGLELEDLAAELAAWYQSLEDAGLDVAAYYQSLEDLAASLEALGWTLEDARTFLHAAVLVYSDMPADLRALGDARESILAGLQAVAWARHDLCIYLEAHSGLILLDLGALLEATDGTAFSHMGAWLCAIHQAPSFRSSVAQRASSVISAVTWPEVEDMGTYLHAAAWSRHDLGVFLQAIAA